MFNLTPERREKLLKSKVIAFDFETSDIATTVEQENLGSNLGLSYLADILCMSICGDDLDVGVVLSYEEMIQEREFIVEIMQEKIVVGHNLQFDWRLLSREFPELCNPVPKKLVDTLTNEYVMAERDPRFSQYGFGLEHLVKYYRIPTDSYPKVLNNLYDFMKGQRKNLGSFTRLQDSELKISPNDYHELTQLTDNVPTFMVYMYASFDAYATYHIYKKQINRIIKYKNTHYHNITDVILWENRFNRSLADMINNGMYVDKKYLNNLIEGWEKELDVHINTLFDMLKESLSYLDEDEDFKSYTEYFDLKNNNSYLRKEKNKLSKDERKPYNETIREQSDRMKEIKSDFSAKEKDIEKMPDEYEVYYDLKRGILNLNASATRKVFFYRVCNVEMPERKPRNAAMFTPKGELSFGKHSIEYLSAEYPLTKLYRTFKDIERKIMDANELLLHSSRTGRIHANTHVGTVTGRTSSSNPNLQNISTQSFKGAVTAPEGRVIIELDIDTAEVVEAALMSGDNELAKDLLSEDFHSATAHKYFGKFWEDVVATGDKALIKKWRNAAKAITFGTLYGQGFYGLSQNRSIPNEVLQVPEDEQELRYLSTQDMDDLMFTLFRKERDIAWAASPDDKEMFRTIFYDMCYSTVEEWDNEDFVHAHRALGTMKILKNRAESYSTMTRAIDMTTEFSEKHGYVRLWSGRHVFVDEPVHKNRNGRNRHYRAWNSVCQGGISDVTRRWLTLLFEYLEQNDTTIKIVNFVHDAILVECDNDPESVLEVGRLAKELLNQVRNTVPENIEGVRWDEVTEPSLYFTTSLDEENWDKWGYKPDEEVPDVDFELLEEYDPYFGS